MRQWSPNTEERFIAILNGEFVFALCCKNLCSNIERQPEFRIGVQHGSRTGKVTISQLILGVITQIAQRRVLRAAIHDNRHACAHEIRGC